MIGVVALFEAKRRLRLVSTYVYFLIFAALGALFIVAAGGGLKGAVVDFGTGGKVSVNSPFALNLFITLTAHFGLPVTAALAGRATCEDVERRATPFFFTAPISKYAYLGGRFLGALLVASLVSLGVGLGAYAAVHLGLTDPSRIGPDRALAYVQPYLVVLLPNLFFTAALFFSIGALARRMLPVQVGAVVLLIGYLIGNNLAGDLEHRSVAALLDPFGIQAVERVTEYWSVAERQTRLVPLAGVLLANRLLWGGAGLAILAFTFAKWRPEHANEGGKKPPEPEPEREPEPGIPREIRGRPATTPWTRALLVLSLARLHLRETVKTVAFRVLVLAGVLMVFVTASGDGRLAGTTTYPVTYRVLETVGGGFSLVIVCVIAFASGELVFREREAGLAQIHDALPVARWQLYLAKLGALLGVILVLLGVVMLCGLGYQAAHGYTRFEPGLYLETLGLSFVKYALLAVLGLFLHTLVNHKYVGHFVMALYFIANVALPPLGFEHHLYRYPSTPEWRYSDMNGFGHFLRGIAHFDAYWAALAVVLAVVTNLLWVRGVDTGWRVRLRLARARLGRPELAVLVVAGAAFVAMGAVIYRSTNRLNHYETAFDTEARAAEYERAYAHFDAEPTARVTGVTLDAVLEPERERAVLRGTLALVNRGHAPVTAVAVTLRDGALVERLELDRPSSRAVDDRRLGFVVLELAAPMAPGDAAALSFELVYEHPGFPNDGSDTRFAYNGTFLDSNYLPSIGYQPSNELGSDEERRRHGFAPKRMRDLDDPRGPERNYVSPTGDWVTLDTTLSTSPEELAIAPGTLLREWSEGGRRHFHYRVDGRVIDYTSLLSARYEIRRDRWKDVAIEIDYHPTHAWDVDRMIRSVKASLDYFTENFGPYQHKEVRIVEFPRYLTFAQSFPGMIPYSEGVGFMMRVDDQKPDEIDFPFYVTAHEVAHQWWAHQVIGADVQGSTLLSETLAQYSALMVMKKTYGEGSMRRFLRYELDRYLRGRGTEKKREVPLLRVENQGYVHYSKGSLAMYSLQDRLGEARVNAALRRFLDKNRFAGPPYPTARALYAELRLEAGEHPGLLEDLFETITLYQNRAVRATDLPLEGGRHRVHLVAEAKKLRAGELGEETPVPVDDWLEVGVLDAKGKILGRQRLHVVGPAIDVTMDVDGIPAKAGVDPVGELIDQKPDDDMVAVEKE